MAAGSLDEIRIRGPGSLTVRFRTLGFVISHPFASKKAKGWGTGQVQELTDNAGVVFWKFTE